MEPKLFRDFFLSIKTREEKENFKAVFMKETKLSYPAFYSYLSGTVKKIPHLATLKILELSKRLQPEAGEKYFPFSDELYV